VRGNGAPSKPIGAAIKARCGCRVETAAGKQLDPPQAAHRPLVPLAVRPSASCVPIPRATDPQDTHYRIAALWVENMAEDPRWKKIAKDATELFEEAETYQSDNNSLNLPNDLILKLVKAAKDLHSERVTSDGTENPEVVGLIEKIKSLFHRGVTHDCEIDEDGECAMCTGIIEVKAM